MRRKIKRLCLLRALRLGERVGLGICTVRCAVG